MARDPGITPEERIEYGVTDEILQKMLESGDYVLDGEIIRQIGSPWFEEKKSLEIVRSEWYWEMMEQDDMTDATSGETLLAVGIFVETPDGVLCTRMV